MEINLLDDSLRVEICFDEEDCEFEDDIRVTFTEDCPDDERLFIHDETNIYLTPEQALTLADELIKAARASRAQAG